MPVLCSPWPTYTWQVHKSEGQLLPEAEVHCVSPVHNQAHNAGTQSRHEERTRKHRVTAKRQALSPLRHYCQLEIQYISEMIPGDLSTFFIKVQFYLFYYLRTDLRKWACLCGQTSQDSIMPKSITGPCHWPRVGVFLTHR